jgi:hypothetical protein
MFEEVMYTSWQAIGASVFYDNATSSPRWGTIVCQHVQPIEFGIIDRETDLRGIR